MIGNGQCLQKETEKSVNCCYKNQQIFRQRQPDLYIVSGDKIYPTHLSVMRQCGLISNKLDKNLNSVILKPSIENQIFQIFLMFIYHPLSLPEINRDKTVLTLLKAAQILQFPTLTQFIYDDFKNCFDLYSIFILYQISLQLGLQWLTDMCNDKLTSQDFKQIQLQKAQFLNLNQQTVIIVLKTHQKLKKNGVIKGLEYQQILQILQQYCKTKQRDLKAKLLLELHDSLSDGYFSHQMGSDSDQVYQEISKQHVESEEQVEGSKNKLNYMQKDAKLRDLFLEYQCVTSPVVTLQQLQAKTSISFESWSINQQNKFMQIQDDYDKISQKDSYDEEDHASSLEESTSQTIFKNKMKTSNVPAINKQFWL